MLGPKPGALTSLNAVVQTAVGTFETECARRGINLSVQISAPSPLVFIGADQIGQVLSQLLSNACHVLRGQPNCRICISAGADGARAFIRVANTGCSQVSAERHSARVRGAGAAPSSPDLALCHAILRRHGGDISVHKSELEEVSTVWLPAAGRQRQPTEAEADSSSTEIRSRRILVLDDEPDVREVLRDVLTHWGHEVICTDDGNWAVTEHNRHPFQAALVDLHMAHMNGFEFLDRLGDDRPTVVVITGRQQPGLAEEVRRLGAAELLMKPFDLGQLRRTLQRLLD